MSRCKLLWGGDDVDGARRVLARMPDPDGLSPREQAWVLASVHLLRHADLRTSRREFATAMRDVHRAFPDDESATFLAAALLATTRPEDADHLAVRGEAVALALPVYQRNPRHPGAAHYLIHALDTPWHAPFALPFARAYARFAPGAFHARHMPAHIFARLGMWEDAIKSCRAAWDASIAAAKRHRLSADHYDLHSLAWLIEINLELGRRKEADAHLARFAEAVKNGLGHDGRAQYASQVASYVVRTQAVERVDALLSPLDQPARTATAPAQHCGQPPAVSPPQLIEKMAVAEARARAAAVRGDRESTQRFLTEMDTLRDQLRPFWQEAMPHELGTLEQAHSRRVGAIAARAAGDDLALIAILRETTALSDPDAGTEGVRGGMLIHEELGDALSRLGKPDEAAVEYATALLLHPSRSHALLGAARTATKTGDLKSARHYYAQLVALWKHADAGIDGLAEARSFLARDP